MQTAPSSLPARTKATPRPGGRAAGRARRGKSTGALGAPSAPVGFAAAATRRAASSSIGASMSMPLISDTRASHGRCVAAQPLYVRRLVVRGHRAVEQLVVLLVRVFSDPPSKLL